MNQSICTENTNCKIILIYYLSYFYSIHSVDRISSHRQNFGFGKKTKTENFRVMILYSEKYLLESTRILLVLLVINNFHYRKLQTHFSQIDFFQTGGKDNSKDIGPIDLSRYTNIENRSLHRLYL